MHVSPTCSFRVVGLDDRSLEKLESSLLKGMSYRKGRYFKDRTKGVLTLPIHDSITPGMLQAILDASGEVIEAAFFVSVSSSQETAIVEIPSAVLNLHKAVGGKVLFSYTCIADSNPENKSDVT